ncbi:MAG: membrane protein insertase YidC, partial [Spirochaetia bacterium]|nr:membrane protein insertase YidC [Spirochaetia bacterium]
NSSMNTDIFRFYIGPQQKQHLSLYNNADTNGFGLKDLQLEKAMDSSSWFGWLENILKWLLAVFYRIIPNYGIAIILLTILIKVILFPITRKSYQSTAKMQALNPQIQEIKEKYKDNSAKMNQEMSALYKTEKVNPMGGCLPMLLQFPIFIALYGLLNKHFELRGAAFIPGWITDLSSPETIWNFAPVNIPFLGSDLRLLPILYVATMVFSMKVSQSATSGTGSNANMTKMFTYVMPIMFFFILYNAPSGLILYWTVMNIFTVIQQRVTNTVQQHHKEEEVKNAAKFKIVKKPNGNKTAGKKPQSKNNKKR